MIYFIVRPLLRALAAGIRAPSQPRIRLGMISWLLIGLLLMFVAFGVVWAISVKIRNYSFLDVIWTYGVAILAPIYAIGRPGHFERKLAFTVTRRRLEPPPRHAHLPPRAASIIRRKTCATRGLRQRWPGQRHVPASFTNCRP